jgi:hypothetical protein
MRCQNGFVTISARSTFGSRNGARGIDIDIDERFLAKIEYSIPVTHMKARITVSLSSGEIAQCRDQLRRATLVQLLTYRLVIYCTMESVN